MQHGPVMRSTRRAAHFAPWCVLFGLLSACGEGVDAPAKTDPKNLVLIVLDTLRPDHLGCYGYERGTSPMLDAFAEECVVFDNALSAAPWTAPALISLMTSLYPEVHRVRPYPNPGRMNGKLTTLAEILRAEGYATAAFTEGGYARGSTGLDEGFDTYPSPPGDDSNWVNQRSAIGVTGNVDRTLEWLSEHSEEPFLLFFHTYETHLPHRAPEPYVKEFRPDYDERDEHARIESAVRVWNERREMTREDCLLILRHRFHCLLLDPPDLEDAGAMADRAAELGLAPLVAIPELVQSFTDTYDAEIRFTDEQVARIFRKLEELQVADDTIVVVVSDHGEGLGQHDRFDHGRSLFDEQLRIVLMIRTLGSPAPGRVSEVVRSIDVMPTVLELMGIEAEGLPFQGQSLVPLMRGEGRELPAFSHSLSVPPAKDVLQSIRVGRWGLIEDLESGNVSLYDLERDPGELNDVAQSEPERVELLRAHLRAQREANGRLLRRLNAPATETVMDAAIQAELQGLGYMGGSDE